MSDELCVVQLDDSSSLRCPAFPEDCSFIVRVYASGEADKRLEANELSKDPSAALYALFSSPGTPIVDGGDGYGSELVLGLADGSSIRCPSLVIEGFWVRIVDSDDLEIAYWDEEEFRVDPEVVLGALMGAASEAVLEIEAVLPPIGEIGPRERISSLAEHQDDSLSI
jgi:hypothetical protein